VTTVDLADGVLTVRCSDERWMPEIARARPLIVSRLQQMLGPDAVRRIALPFENSTPNADRPAPFENSTPNADRPAPDQ
jgi:hypothetical protein